MFEQISQGFLGLFLVLGQWILPAVDKAELSVASPMRIGSTVVISCDLSFGYTDQLGQLVDAGIPLRFKWQAASDGGDTISLVREICYVLQDDRYQFKDSLSSGVVTQSKKFPQILLAIREAQRFTTTMRYPCTSVKLEAVLLPSHASRLNRNVDLSPLIGMRQVSRVVSLK